MTPSKKNIYLIAGLLLFNVIGLANAQQSKAVLSSRSFHPLNGNDTLSTIKVIDELKPDRIEWMYADDPKKLALLQERGIKYSLAINPQTSDSAGYTTVKTRIVDINGKPYIAPWMRTIKSNASYWGCANNPLFQEVFYKNARKLVNLGAYAIFVDDGLFNVQLQSDNPKEFGCFCSYCLDGFSKYLKDINRADLATGSVEQLKEKLKYSVDQYNQNKANINYLLVLYQKYQVESVVRFLQEWKSRLLADNSSLKFYTNNSNGEWNDVYKVFDGGMAELSPAHVNKQYLDRVYALAASLHKTQLFTLVSENVRLQYYLMAYDYLNGHDYTIPWDIFIGNNRAGKTSRFYADLGDVKKITDIFADGDPSQSNRAPANSVNVDRSSSSSFVVRSKSNGGYYQFVLSNDPNAQPKVSIRNRGSFIPGIRKVLREDSRVNSIGITPDEQEFDTFQIYKLNNQ
jgi:hypothetical protein